MLSIAFLTPFERYVSCAQKRNETLSLALIVCQGILQIPHFQGIKLKLNILVP